MRYILFSFIIILTSACGSGPSPAHYAKKFCSCSEELGKATVQLQMKRIEKEVFDKARLEQEKCMGDADPLKQIKDEKQKLEFQAAFLKAIFEKCPNVARNMGFKE
jgi:hypothetical protein